MALKISVIKGSNLTGVALKLEGDDPVPSAGSATTEPQRDTGVTWNLLVKTPHTAELNESNADSVFKSVLTSGKGKGEAGFT